MQIWCEGRRKVQEMDVDLALGRSIRAVPRVLESVPRVLESEDLRNAEESMCTRVFDLVEHDETCFSFAFPGCPI